MLNLVLPTAQLHEAFLDCRDDWGFGVHEDGFGLQSGDEVQSPERFAVWVDRLIQEEHPPESMCPSYQHATHRWIMQDRQLIGGIALRHHLDESLGQLGYGIRPSERGKGRATWAVGEMLEIAGQLGIRRVLVVCAGDNVASMRTIERHDGVLADIRNTDHGQFKRYWIALA